MPRLSHLDLEKNIYILFSRILNGNNISTISSETFVGLGNLYQMYV